MCAFPVTGGMSAPQVFGIWTVGSVQEELFIIALDSPRDRESMCRAGGKVFDSVLSYSNFSLEVFLILPLNRVCPEDKALNLPRV